MEQVAQQGKCQSNVIENSTGGFLREKSSKEKWVKTIKVVNNKMRPLCPVEKKHQWWCRICECAAARTLVVE